MISSAEWRLGRCGFLLSRTRRLCWFPRENAAAGYKCDHGREERAQFYQLQPFIRHSHRAAPGHVGLTKQDFAKGARQKPQRRPLEAGSVCLPSPRQTAAPLGYARFLCTMKKASAQKQARPNKTVACPQSMPQLNLGLRRFVEASVRRAATPKAQALAQSRTKVRFA
jgi:hypothetical protein